MKICVSIFLLQVAASLAGNVPLPNSDGKGHDEFFNIHSAHIPAYISPMDLTTGELKLFAGHSMQFLKAKCPAVPKDQLTQISKYIAKLVSKTNPVPERSPKFDKLLNSLSSCAANDRAAAQPSFFHSFLTPFIRIKGFFSGEPETVKGEAIKKVESDSAAAPTPTDTIKDDQALEVLPTEQPKKEDLKTLSADSETEEVQTDPAPKRPAITQPAKEETPIFRTVSYTNTDGSWNPIGWMRNIFHAVRDYFQRIFGADNVMYSGSTVSYRTKRDVADEEARADDDKDDNDKLDDQKTLERLTATYQKKEDQGKLAFLQLMDTLCRKYCSECQDPSQILNFKAASKALLNFIYEDTTGVELAAKHYLDPTLLETLEKC